MRRTDKEITSREEMEAVLLEAFVCRLAMTDGEMPYVIALNFAYVDGVVYFHAATSGRKLDLIAKNPNVCLEADVGSELIVGEIPCKCGMCYRSVVATGVATLVGDLAEKGRALELIAAKYTGRNDIIPAAALGAIAVIRMEIRSMTGKRSPARG